MDTPSNERIALDILLALLAQATRGMQPLEKDAALAVSVYKAILKSLHAGAD